MKKALIAVSILLVAAGCNQQATSQPSKENTQSSLKKMDSQTYNSSDHPFTFDYPLGWTLTTIPGNSIELRSSPNETNLGIGLLSKDQLGIEIGLVVENNTQDLKTWCEDYISKIQTSPTFTTSFSNSKEIIVSGQKAYKVDYQVKEDLRMNGRQICVERNKEKYILTAYPLDSKIISSFDDIVTSFKFVR